MKTTARNLEERQANVADVARLVEQLSAALQNAESCETPADFDANLDDAISAAETILSEAKALRCA